MSPQSASRGPVGRVYVAVSHALETYVPTAGEGGLGRTSDDFCPIFGIPSWLMPLRDRSGQRWQPSGKPYVVAATKVCSRLIGVCWSLSPPPPPTLPFSFLAFWGFPEWNTQDFPFLSLVLSFLLFFLSSPSSLDVPGCFVIAGSPSFLVCPWTPVP